jgi:tRNA(Met) C34 N-acetyltransferase TmcA
MSRLMQRTATASLGWLIIDEAAALPAAAVGGLNRFAERSWLATHSSWSLW